MKGTKQYFRQHKFAYWVMLVIISFAVYAGGQALFGRMHWAFVVIMSIAQPTGIVLLSSVNKN